MGSDSQFRGLNVGLATPGAGVAAGDLDWEYWNGTSWVSMESGFSFTDTTDSFTKTGTLSWTDLSSWAPYSVNGGPDLYYVRAYLKTGATYSTPPQEGLIKTDILLFQYCGDISAAAQEFVLGAPLPTVVRLMSFSAAPGNGSVSLEWRTGSELNNLGFHLYRGPSADGPWTRLTSSLIPGLGSSPLGQAYSWLDSGLVNGQRYYYRLEDVDTASVSTFHGPVSAVPERPRRLRLGKAAVAAGVETARKAVRRACRLVLPRLGSRGRSGRCVPGLHEARVPRVGLAGHPLARCFLGDGRAADGGLLDAAEPSGTVRAFVPGLRVPTDPKAPALPLRRALVDAVVGKQVHLVSAEALRASVVRGPSSLGGGGGGDERVAGRDGAPGPPFSCPSHPLPRLRAGRGGSSGGDGVPGGEEERGRGDHARAVLRLAASSSSSPVGCG